MLKLLCNASGNQPIVYHWKKDDFEINSLINNRRYSIITEDKDDEFQTMLIIEPIERVDSSMFTCVATNKYGLAEKTFRVIVQEQPEPPFNVIINEIKSDSLEISWSKPYSSNLPIIEYIIQYSSTPNILTNHPFKEITRTGSETSAYIYDLKPSTVYDFKIVARNLIGKSEPSKVVSIATLDKSKHESNCISILTV